MRSHRVPANAVRSSVSVLTIGTLSILLSACSSDVSRFDFPSFGLAQSSKPVPQADLNRPRAAARPRSDYAFRPNYREDIAPSASLGGNGERGGYDRSRDVAASNLPVIERPTMANRGPYARPATPRPDYRTARASDPAPYQPDPKPASRSYEPAPAPVASRGSVTVRSGDTLYAIARRENVTVAALREANDMTGATIKPGQVLTLPGGRAQIAARERRRPPSDNGTAHASYTVQSGDSLYAIARRKQTTVAALQAANPDIDPRSLKPGQSLVIPGEGTPSRTARRAAPKPAPSATAGDYTRYAKADTGRANDAPRRAEVGSYQRTQETRVIRSPGAEQAAARKPKRVALLPAPEARSGAQFRWPAQGRIVAGFGKRGDGRHNDGINIAIPKGTPIKASENGVVAYAGNELKGYGNLVLIRHADNWVSAYAHADRLLVKRGDQVTRGQKIATAGMTGEVQRPQLHFELRKGSKPVDPMKYLASN